jgi:CO/xanthine dehydrogenase FAD-binding subunit
VFEGQVVTPELLARAAAPAAGAVAPEDDWLGSAEYRRAMASVLARRALEQAWADADGGLRG